MQDSCTAERQEKGKSNILQQDMRLPELLESAQSMPHNPAWSLQNWLCY
jgi:hypothetical protein